MRRSRDELARDVEEMVRLRTEENKTYRQIALLMGYKSPGTISDLLRRRGHYSVVLNQLEINFILQLLNSVDATKLNVGIKNKLTKLKGE